MFATMLYVFFGLGHWTLWYFVILSKSEIFYVIFVVLSETLFSTQLNFHDFNE